MSKQQLFFFRLLPHQETRTTTELLDIVYVENDGPNQMSYGRPWTKVKLYKKSKEGTFVEVVRPE